MHVIAMAAFLLAFATGAEAQEAQQFRVPVALFVKQRATGYGMYEARPTNHFKAGEPLLFYVEPVDFKYKADGDLAKFGAVMDLRLTQDGKTLFSKDGFVTAAFTSHHMNKEINFSGSLDVSGAPAGEYELELLLQDSASDGVATVVLPFVID